MHTLMMGHQCLARSDAHRLALEVSVVCGRTCNTACREAHGWVVHKLQWTSYAGTPGYARERFLAGAPGKRSYLSAPHRLLRHGESVLIGARVSPGAPLDPPPRNVLDEIAQDLQDLGEWESLPRHSYQSEVAAHLAEREQVSVTLPRPLACLADDVDLAGDLAGAVLVLSMRDACELWGRIHDAIERHKSRARDLEDHFRCTRDDAKRWRVPVGTRAYRKVDGAVYVELPQERLGDSAVTWQEVRTAAGVDRPATDIQWPPNAEMVS